MFTDETQTAEGKTLFLFLCFICYQVDKTIVNTELDGHG